MTVVAVRSSVACLAAAVPQASATAAAAGMTTHASHLALAISTWHGVLYHNVTKCYHASMTSLASSVVSKVVVDTLVLTPRQRASQRLPTAAAACFWHLEAIGYQAAEAGSNNRQLLCHSNSLAGLQHSAVLRLHSHFVAVRPLATQGVDSLLPCWWLSPLSTSVASCLPVFFAGWAGTQKRHRCDQ